MKHLLAFCFSVLLCIPAFAADPVKVGVGISETGMFAPEAAEQLNSYKMWVDEVNKAGGLDVAGTKRPINLIVYDDQSDFGKEAGIYEKLITDDKVDLLLAPWGTPFHFAIVGVLERYGFPMVGNSAASVQLRTIKPGNIWFPTSAIPDKMAPALVKLMQEQGVKTVAVNTLQLPFSQELKKFLMPALKEAGMKVVVDQEYAPDVKDMTATVEQIKQTKPDAVLGLSYPQDALLLLKTEREQDIKAPFQFLLVGPAEAFFTKSIGAPALNDVAFMGHWTPYQKAWPKAMPFFEAYKARFGIDPDYLDVDLAWMSTEILQQAVAKAGLDHAKLRQEISTATFDTINGPVKFKGVENIITPTMFMQFQDGKAEIVYPPSVETAKFQKKTSWGPK
jgi:branched-chain amino acid transport system substrate-binding protein